MDYAQISSKLIDIWLPYLPALLNKQEIPPDAKAEEKRAYDLWALVYPKISMKASVMGALKALIEDDSERNRNNVLLELTSAFMVNNYFAQEVAAALGKKTSNQVRGTEIQNQIPPTTRPGAVHPAQSGEPAKLVCQECGRSDDSVRLINYPYVVSMVFLTSRRRFHGLYCAKHARKYFLYAVLITITIGWLGVPFGVIFAPLTLFNLLFADRKLDPANAKLQRHQAAQLLREGKKENAFRSAIRSLYYQMEDETFNLINKIGVHPISGEAPSMLTQFLASLAILGGSFLIGLVLGSLDVLVTMPFWDLTTNNLLAVIFTWVPTVIFYYLGAFLVSALVSEGIKRARISTSGLAGAYGFLGSLLTAYAINSGNYLVFEIYYKMFHNLSFTDGLGYLIDCLVNGGLYKLATNLQFEYTSDSIWLVIWLPAVAAAVLLSVREGVKTAGWNASLQKINTGTIERHSNQGTIGWFALVIFVFMFFGTSFLFSPQTTEIAGTDLNEKINEVFALIDAEEYGQAKEIAEAVLAEAPDNVDSLYALGLIALSQADCLGAIAPLEKGLEYASGIEISAFHYGLGFAHYCVGNFPASKEAFLQAVEGYGEDVWGWYYLGKVYSVMGEYSQAIDMYNKILEIDPDWATPYARLALHYYILGDLQAATDAIDQARDLAEEVDYDYFTIAEYYLQVGDYEQADQYFSLGIQAFPTDPDYLNGKIFTLIASDEVIMAQTLFNNSKDQFLGSEDYYTLAGELEMAYGNFEAAFRIFDEMERIYRGDASNQSTAFYELAYYYFDREDYSAAMETAEQAVTLQPYNFSAQGMIALINYQTGKQELACEQAAEVDSIHPLASLHHYVLGKCAIDSGDESLAIEEFEKYMLYTWNKNRSRIITREVKQFLESAQGD